MLRRKPQTHVLSLRSPALVSSLQNLIPKNFWKSDNSLKGSKTSLHCGFLQCLCHPKMQLPHIWLVHVHTLKAERGVHVTEAYVEAGLVLCKLDRVTGIQT